MNFLSEGIRGKRLHGFIFVKAGEIYFFMKHLFSVVLLLVAGNMAKAQNRDGGKTFYDSEKKKLKEVFHYKEITRYYIDPKDTENFIDSTFAEKNGPYVCYHENGKLKMSGYYKSGIQDGLWKYYNTEGVLIRQEQYNDGKVLK